MLDPDQAYLTQQQPRELPGQLSLAGPPQEQLHAANKKRGRNTQVQTVALSLQQTRWKRIAAPSKFPLSQITTIPRARFSPTECSPLSQVFQSKTGMYNPPLARLPGPRWGCPGHARTGRCIVRTRVRASEAHVLPIPISQYPTGALACVLRHAETFEDTDPSRCVIKEAKRAGVANTSNTLVCE